MPLPPPGPAPARRRAAAAVRAADGQAAAEHAALLTLVALLLAGAGAAAGGAAGVADVPGRVAHALRTGICIVGGDICRPADADAAGLAPCVIDERARGAGATLTIVSLRFGERGEWTVARRSDGSVLVTRVDDRRAGIGGGIGLELGELELGASGSLDIGVATGSAWELPDAGAAARFLAAARTGHADRVAPTWRFGDLGAEVAGRLGIDVAGTELTGLEASASAAAGARVGRGETTVYVDANLDTGPLDLVPGGRLAARGGSTAPGGGRTGPLLVSLTRDAHGLRELAFRRVEAGRDGEVIETAGRLDLRDPGNRAAVAPLLAARLPWPPSVRDALAAAVRRTAVAGTIERSVYAVSDRSHELAAAVRLGAELGIEASRLDVSRRLVAASAWTAGSSERRRVDCVGEA